MLRAGDAVLLHTPYNPRLHNTQAVVAVVTEWGAHLRAPAAATGAYRAAWEEMVPQAAVNGAARGQAVAAGYTGDVCETCGGSRMKRAGACLVCEECGSNSGCG